VCRVNCIQCHSNTGTPGRRDPERKRAPSRLFHKQVFLEASNPVATDPDKSRGWLHAIRRGFWKQEGSVVPSRVMSAISALNSSVRARDHFFFSSDSQFATSVIGSEVEGCRRLLIRKRCPSGDTSNVHWGEGRLCV